jgi:hypothetical protein
MLMRLAPGTEQQATFWAKKVIFPVNIVVASKFIFSMLYEPMSSSLLFGACFSARASLIVLHTRCSQGVGDICPLRNLNVASVCCAQWKRRIGFFRPTLAKVDVNADTVQVEQEEKLSTMTYINLVQLHPTH